MKIPELQLQNELMGQAATALPNIRLFRTPVIRAEIKPGVFVAAGQPGFPDITAIGKGGACVFIELKSLGGVQSEAQRRFQKWAASWDTPYLLLKPEKGEDMNETIARWLAVISEAFGSGEHDLSPGHCRGGG